MRKFATDMIDKLPTLALFRFQNLLVLYLLLCEKDLLDGSPWPGYKIQDGGLSCNEIDGTQTSLDGLVVEHWSLPVVTLLKVAFLWRT